MKVPKPKKRKKDSLDSTMLAKWSELVKIKADWKCEYCGTTKTLNSHHVFTKKNRATRWDVENGICLCASHHTLGNFSAHGSPAFADWMKEYRGEEWYIALRDKSNSIVKHSRKDKLAIMEGLKAMIKELE